MGLGRDRSERSAPGEGIRGVGQGIARDVAMGFASGPFASRDKQASNLSNRGYTQDQIRDFQSRTAATMERNQQQADRDSGGRDRNENLPPRVTLPFLPPVTEMPITPGPVTPPPPPQVTPEMRREALRIFESQRGAGQVPYQMMPYQMQPYQPPGDGFLFGNRSQGSSYTQGLGSLPSFRAPPQAPMQQNPNASPAFQYAAQNYSRLGGSQRLMDRPMEMMSVAERQRINEMAQGMLPQTPPQVGPNEVASILSRMSAGKGGGMVQPQTPRPMPRPSQVNNRPLPGFSGANPSMGGLMSMRNRSMPPR